MGWFVRSKDLRLAEIKNMVRKKIKITNVAIANVQEDTTIAS
jgi:hypothetical protein